MATAHDPSARDARRGAKRPGALRLASAIVGVEALLLLAAGAYLLVASSVGQPAQRLAGLVGGAMAVAMGLALGLVARALGCARRWGRAPAILWQLLTLPVAYAMVASHLPSVGLPLLALAVVGLGTLFAPATNAALGDAATGD